MADGSIKNKVEGSVTPYTLTSADHPGSLITHVQLKGSNYEEWAKAMRVALRAKKKLGFVDGTVTQPADKDSKIDGWCMINSMLIAWFFNTIEPTLRSTITYRETAKELRDDLQLRFAVANGPRINQLKNELAECKQRGHSVAEYFGKMKMLLDEINNYEPIISCSCGGCKCRITETLRTRREDEQVHQFLMGLEDSMFGTVRSTILNLDPLPNLNRVYAMIVTEEQHRTVARNRDDMSDAVAYLAQSKIRVGPGVTRDKLESCKHCGRTGHDESSCFQVVGYPDWWGDRPKGSGRGGGRGSIRGGGRGRGIARAHAAQTTIGKGSTSSSTKADKGGLYNLTSEQ